MNDMTAAPQASQWGEWPVLLVCVSFVLCVPQQPGALQGGAMPPGAARGLGQQSLGWAGLGCRGWRGLELLMEKKKLTRQRSPRFPHRLCSADFFLQSVFSYQLIARETLNSH